MVVITMDVYNTILSRRSIRRFQQKSININLLKKIVNGARLAPSAANLQPLEYFIITNRNLRSEIFKTLSWANYIKPKWIPSEKERPTAYIIVLIKDINNPYYLRDVGLATENIILAAEGEKISSCIICKINKKRIEDLLKLPDDIHVDSVIALGYKSEHVVIEDLKESIEYWRDKDGVLHVPKRKLEDIIHINIFKKN